MRTRDVPLLPIRDRLARIRKSSVQGRREAAKELEGSSDPSAGLILLYMLEDVSPDVRDQALRSLVSRGGLLARIGARACLQDSVSYVRNSAAEALGVFGDVRAGYGLQQALETGDMVLRCSAATSLGRLRFSKAVGALWTAASKDPEAAVRRDAALALSRLDAPALQLGLKKCSNASGTPSPGLE